MVTKYPGKLKVTLLYVTHWRLMPLQAHPPTHENPKPFPLGCVTFLSQPSSPRRSLVHRYFQAKFTSPVVSLAQELA